MVTDRIQNSQVALDRANLNVEKSTQSLKVAQDHASEAGVALDAATDKLSEAIDQYGAGSVEAQKAQDDLTAAQTKYQDATTQVQIKTEALTVSQERADMAQRNFNATLLTSSLSVIPSVISIGTQAYQMYDKWQNSTSALDNSTQGLNGTLGGNANASNGASSSGGGLASTLGLLSLAVASVGTSLALTNQKLDDAAAKGAKFSDVEKDTYTASMALGGGIGVYLGSQITSFLGLLDQSDAALDKLATKFEEQNTPIQDVINGLTNLGYSKASIDSVVASMQNMSDVSSQVASQVTVNMLTITTAVNGATTAVSTTTGITGTGATAIPTSGGTLPNEYQPPVGGGGSGVHMYEAGGIATREQLAVLAEQEPEAVIPLSELGDIASIGVGRNQIPQHITNNITLQIGNISNEVDLDKIPEKVSEGIAEFYRRRSY